MDLPSSPQQLEPFPAGAIWSIAEVERDTGLGKDTLRVWEKRYAFPRPFRDANGERAYPSEQVRRLRLIKRLLDAGHRPGKVVSLSEQQMNDLLPTTLLAESSPHQPPVPRLWSGTDVPWLQWLADNRADLVKQALQQHILRQGLAATVERLIAPLCVHVGEAWLSGDLSVFQEHLFTETLQGVLREAIAAVDASGRSSQQLPRVLLTTTPSEQHGLGLLMAECFFALESCERMALGTATPLADIVMAVQQLKIDVLALSFSAHASRRDVHESLFQLQAQLPAKVEIWVGGSAVALHRRGMPDGVVVLHRAIDVGLQVQAWRLRRGAV